MHCSVEQWSSASQDGAAPDLSLRKQPQKIGEEVWKNCLLRRVSRVLKGSVRAPEVFFEGKPKAGKQRKHSCKTEGAQPQRFCSRGFS